MSQTVTELAYTPTTRMERGPLGDEDIEFTKTLVGKIAEVPRMAKPNRLPRQARLH